MYFSVVVPTLNTMDSVHPLTFASVSTRDPAARLAGEIVDLLRAYLADERRGPRTALLRTIAPKIVDLRQHFHLEDGRTDWSGRSSDYRRIIADVYTRAGVTSDLADTVQAALRYHVGNELRERVPSSELEDVGLTRPGPRERLKESRDTVNALTAVLNQLKHAGPDDAGPALDPLRLVVGAEAMLLRVELQQLEALTEDRRGAVSIALSEIVRRAEELRGGLEPPAKKRRKSS